MNLKNPKHLARALLDIEIPFPESDPDNPIGPPLESPKRLGELLTTAIPDVIFPGPGIPATLAESSGPDWKPMISDYVTLCTTIKALGVTGRADRGALRRGEAALELMIEWVSRDEQGARAMLDPHSREVIDFHKRLGTTAAQGSKDMQDSYFSYLCFRCTRDALETLRDGLREINGVLATGPDSQAR